MNNIPKIFYLFWDMSKISLLQTFTLYTFHNLNPDWRVIVYLFKQNYKQLGINTFVPHYTGKDYWHLIEAMDFVEFIEIDLEEYNLDLSTHGILISDRLRMQKLYEHGGVYSDFDVLWLRPMTEFVNIECMGDTNDFECTASMHDYTKGFHSVSNFVAEANSTYVRSILDAQAKELPPFGHQSFGSVLFNRLYPSAIDLILAYQRILILKYETFFPYDVEHLTPLYREDDITRLASKNVMAVHWFNGHKLSKEYINGDKYGSPCSMSSLLKKLDLI